jgi:hypothetical protein
MIVGARLLARVGRKKNLSGTESTQKTQNFIASKETKELLHPADPDQAIPASITEGPTKILDKLKS